MIVVVDERATVTQGYTAWFNREGISACGLAPAEFDGWVQTVSDPDVQAVEAFLLGTCENRGALSKIIRRRSTSAAIIAMLRHYVEDREFIYGLDLKHLDEMRARRREGASHGL